MTLRAAAARWAALPALGRAIAIDEIEHMASNERKFAKGYAVGSKLRRRCNKFARIFETIGALLRAAQATPKRRGR